MTDLTLPVPLPFQNKKTELKKDILDRAAVKHREGASGEAMKMYQVCGHPPQLDAYPCNLAHTVHPTSPLTPLPIILFPSALLVPEGLKSCCHVPSADGLVRMRRCSSHSSREPWNWQQEHWYLAASPIGLAAGSVAEVACSTHAGCAPSFARVLLWVASTKHPTPRCYFVSDMQSTDWGHSGDCHIHPSVRVRPPHQFHLAPTSSGAVGTDAP
jgi:hypothetical protein